MKADYRIATKDQYCYIEAHGEGTPQEIVEQYGELYNAYWNRSQVSDEEFTQFLINAATGKGNDDSLLEKLSPEQRKISKLFHKVISVAYPFKK